MRPDAGVDVTRAGVAALGEAAAIDEHRGGDGGGEFCLHLDEARVEGLKPPLLRQGEQAGVRHEGFVPNHDYHLRRDAVSVGALRGGSVVELCRHHASGHAVSAPVDLPGQAVFAHAARRFAGVDARAAIVGHFVFQLRVTLADDVSDLTPGMEMASEHESAGLVDAASQVLAVVVEGALGDNGDGVSPGLEVDLRGRAVVGVMAVDGHRLRGHDRSPIAAHRR